MMHIDDVLRENERLREINAQLVEAIGFANRYFADLNGCEWIRGDGPGERDMRQRARALQRHLYAAKARSRGQK
jgi:hypothetical protein